MIEAQPPEHMDKWTRNERVYRFLLGLGLVVTPIFEDHDHTRIKCLVVAAALDHADPVESISEQASQLGIIAPVEGPEIGEGVGSIERGRENVVDFPPVL